MQTVFLDFETRSTEDLKTAGAHRYAAHPTTEIICMAYAIDDGPVKVWFDPQSLPQDFAAAYVNGSRFVAHNAPFEREMWANNTDLFLSPAPVTRAGPAMRSHWICTAARAAAMGLPRNLGDAAEALGLPFKKDLEGRSLAIKMSKPRSLNPIVWWDEPDKLAKLYNYCADDVRATRALYYATRALDDNELDTYELDQTMNDRGVRVDMSLVDALREIALVGITRANAVIAACTGGDVERVTQVARMQRWLGEQGVDVDNLTKATVSETLEQVGLPSAVEKVLTVRSEAGRTSIAKLDAITKGIDYQGTEVLRGLLLYHGAHTGRWAGRRVQPQNFPRGTVKDPEFFIDLVLQNEYEIINVLDNPLNVVSSLLRATLIPRTGNRFVIGDFSSIEAIVLAWLAGQDDLVARFASGENVYKVEGESVGATRQHGKAILLGCGFGMGAPKFIEAAKNMFGLDVSQAQATEFVNGYRDRYTKIPTFWYELQDAFIDVVERTKDEATVGYLTIKRRGRRLWIILPSGRAMAYHNVRHDDGQLSIMRVHPETKQWQRRTIWGGFLAENVTQAVARDVMVASMKRLEAAGYPLVLTVHDEIIADVPNQHGSLQDFLQIMAEAPSWSDNMPVLANGFEAQRYRKG